MSLIDFLIKGRLTNSLFGRNLFAGIAYTTMNLLATPNPSEAQESEQDTFNVVYSIPELVVNVNVEQIPEEALFTMSGRDPNLALYFKVPEINSIVPGLGNMPYKHIPGGSVLYRHGVPFVGRSDLNHSITSSFSTYPTEQINTIPTAIMPSVDMSLEMRTMRDENDFFINAQPLQLSGGFGYGLGRFKLDGSAQILRIPSIFPKRIKDYLKVLGEGERVHIVGEFETERQNGTEILSIEGYSMDLETDFEKEFRASKFKEKDQQSFVIAHTEHPLSEGRTLEFTTGFQSSLSDLRIQKDDEEERENIHQDIRLFTLSSNLNNSSGSFGLAFHNLEKTNILGDEKDYSILQLSADRLYSLPLGLESRMNGRVDFIQERDPKVSIYGTVERQISGLTFGISGAILHDAVIHEVLKSPLTEFIPSSETEIQTIRYGEGSLEAKFGNHILEATMGIRNVDMPLSIDANIEGSYYNASYMWSGENSFLTFSASFRPMQMHLEGEPRSVPGSPKEELKVIAGKNGDGFSAGMSMAIQSGSSFPVRTRGDLRFIDLGRRIILNPYLSANSDRFSLGLTIVNTLELFEKIGIINDFDNILAVYDDGRNSLEMPGFAYFSLEFRP